MGREACGRQAQDVFFLFRSAARADDEEKRKRDAHEATERSHSPTARDGGDGGICARPLADSEGWRRLSVDLQGQGGYAGLSARSGGYAGLSARSGGFAGLSARSGGFAGLSARSGGFAGLSAWMGLAVGFGCGGVRICAWRERRPARGESITLQMGYEIPFEQYLIYDIF